MKSWPVLSVDVKYAIVQQQPKDSIIFNLSLQDNSKMLAKNQMNNRKSFSPWTVGINSVKNLTPKMSVIKPFKPVVLTGLTQSASWDVHREYDKFSGNIFNLE